MKKNASSNERFMRWVVWSFQSFVITHKDKPGEDTGNEVEHKQQIQTQQDIDN